MKSLVIILTGLFSFFLFDPQINRRQRRGVTSTAFIEVSLFEQKERTKRIQRKYKNKKYKTRKLYPEKRFKYRHTRPKDSRFSNQKSLRRMYRNS
jgi:hypothetical protein